MTDMTPTPSAASTTPAGWYPDSASGMQRWWDGQKWTENFQPAAQPTHVTGPATAASLNVKREVSYVRQQKGHSAILHWIFLGPFTLWILPIYYTLSPNHYWHA